MVRVGAGGMSGGILNRGRTRLRGQVSAGPKEYSHRQLSSPGGSMNGCQALAEGLQTPTGSWASLGRTLICPFYCLLLSGDC